MPDLWQGLDASFSGCAVTAVWREIMGAEFDTARTAFFDPMEELAQSYPCPRQCGCTHQVVEHSPTDLEAVCECEDVDCAVIPLQPEDLVRWQLNLARLGRAVTRALEIDRREKDLGIWGTRQIGAWSTDAVPVILAMAREAEAFRHLVTGLVAQIRERFILLAPTSRPVDVTILQLLGGARSAFFPLEGNFTPLPGGGLHARQSAGTLFSAFRPQSSAAVNDTEAQRVFALMKSLDAGPKKRKAPLDRVFRMLVLEGHSQEAVAQQCRCAKSLVSSRVDEIERTMGRSIADLRGVATGGGGVQAPTQDPRARSLYRRGLVDDSEEEEDS